MVIIMDSIRSMHEVVLVFVRYRNHINCAALHGYSSGKEMKSMCEKPTIRKRMNPKKNVASKNASWIGDANTQLSR